MLYPVYYKMIVKEVEQTEREIKNRYQNRRSRIEKWSFRGFLAGTLLAVTTSLVSMIRPENIITDPYYNNSMIENYRETTKTHKKIEDSIQIFNEEINKYSIDLPYRPKRLNDKINNTFEDWSRRETIDSLIKEYEVDLEKTKAELSSIESTEEFTAYNKWNKNVENYFEYAFLFGIFVMLGSTVTGEYLGKNNKRMMLEELTALNKPKEV